MKKIIFTLLFAFVMVFVGKISAQTIGIFYPDGSSAINDTIKITASVDSTDMDQEIVNDNFVHIVNIGNDSNTYMLRRVEHNIINNTQDMMCWGALCFIGPMAGVDPIWDPKLDSLIMAPGDTAGTQPGTYGLKIYFLPNGNVGNVLYEYQVYNKNDPLGVDYSSVFVEYDLSHLTSVRKYQQVKHDFSIYPNPVSDIANIDVNIKSNAGEYKLVVRDILGKEVEAKTITYGANHLKINMEAYSSGVYFVSIMNQLEVLETKKMIVK